MVFEFVDFILCIDCLDMKRKMKKFTSSLIQSSSASPSCCLARKRVLPSRSGFIPATRTPVDNRDASSGIPLTGPSELQLPPIPPARRGSTAIHVSALDFLICAPGGPRCSFALNMNPWVGYMFLFFSSSVAFETPSRDHRIFKNGSPRILSGRSYGFI